MKFCATVWLAKFVRVAKIFTELQSLRPARLSEAARIKYVVFVCKRVTTKRRPSVYVSEYHQKFKTGKKRRRKSKFVDDLRNCPLSLVKIAYMQTQTYMHIQLLYLPLWNRKSLRLA